jgi:hypothetical protein
MKHVLTTRQEAHTHSTVLDALPFRVDLHRLLARLHVDRDSSYAQEVRALVRDAEAVSHPKALYCVAYVDSRGDDWVVVNQVRFSSRVLAVNLEGVHRIFAYVATCGVELDAWAHSIDDVLCRYWTEAIREMALRRATVLLHEHLEQRFQLVQTATMSPGRLADWPLREQVPLFELLGDTVAAIGVHLTDSYLMIPTKSVSGIRYPTQESFESCQLCPREVCPNRKAPYEKDLYQTRYGVASR